MTNAPDSYDVAIAGAGPAGTSAAIHLAMRGARVVLVEQKKFPRAKLCGEFISPECRQHFQRLGVDERIISAGGASLTQTVFYSRSGHTVTVPSEWFGGSLSALGLSRAEMDQKLLERARDAGVFVLEDAQASDLILEEGKVCGIRLKSAKQTKEIRALITLDATGRTRALARKLESRRKERRARSRPRLIAFKAHLENVQVAEGACEIYSYPGGYGGLNGIEGGLSNFCFITSAEDVRRCGSDPETVIRKTVFRNSRAACTLAHYQRRTDWLSVSLEGFGRNRLVPAPGLLTIGDAAAFIDPFTGSGMLMALEGGEVAALTILNHLEKLGHNASFARLASEFRQQYAKRFDSRLRISGLLRRAAFIPWFAEAAIYCFSLSTRLRRNVARATRPSIDREAQHLKAAE